MKTEAVMQLKLILNVSLILLLIFYIQSCGSQHEVRKELVYGNAKPNKYFLKTDSIIVQNEMCDTIYYTKYELLIKDSFIVYKFKKIYKNNKPSFYIKTGDTVEIIKVVLDTLIELTYKLDSNSSKLRLKNELKNDLIPKLESNLDSIIDKLSDIAKKEQSNNTAFDKNASEIRYAVIGVLKEVREIREKIKISSTREYLDDKRVVQRLLKDLSIHWVNTTSSKLKRTFDYDKIYYAPGKYMVEDFSKSAKNIIDSYISEIKSELDLIKTKNPKSNFSLSIRVYGYADEMDFKYHSTSGKKLISELIEGESIDRNPKIGIELRKYLNQKLSKKRSSAIYEYMSQHIKLIPIEVEGFGESLPEIKVDKPFDSVDIRRRSCHVSCQIVSD